MQPCVRGSSVSLTSHVLGCSFTFLVTGTVPDTDPYQFGLHPGTGRILYQHLLCRKGLTCTF